MEKKKRIASRKGIEKLLNVKESATLKKLQERGCNQREKYKVRNCCVERKYSKPFSN